MQGKPRQPHPNSSAPNYRHQTNGAEGGGVGGYAAHRMPSGPTQPSQDPKSQPPQQSISHGTMQPIQYSSPRGGQVQYPVRSNHRLQNNNGGPRLSLHHQPLQVYMQPNQPLYHATAPIIMSPHPGTMPFLAQARHPGQASGQTAGGQQTYFHQSYNLPPMNTYNTYSGYIMPTAPQTMRHQYSQSAAPTQVHPQQPTSQQPASNQFDMFGMEGVGSGGPAVPMSSLSGTPGGPNGAPHQLLGTQPPTAVSLPQSALPMAQLATQHKPDKQKLRPNAIPIINPDTGAVVRNDDDKTSSSSADSSSSQTSIPRESKDEELKTQRVVHEFAAKVTSVAFPKDLADPPQSTTPVTVDISTPSSGAATIASDDERDWLNGPVDHEQSEITKEPSPPPMMVPSPPVMAHQVAPVPLLHQVAPAPQLQHQAMPTPQHHQVGPTHPPHQNIPIVSALIDSPQVTLPQRTPQSMSGMVKVAPPAQFVPPTMAQQTMVPPTTAPPVQPSMSPPPPPTTPATQIAPTPSTPAPAGPRKPQAPSENAIVTKKPVESKKKEEPAKAPEARPVAKALQEPTRPVAKVPPGARGGPRPVPASTPPPSASTTVVGAPSAPPEFPPSRPAPSATPAKPSASSSFFDTINYKNMTSTTNVNPPPPTVPATPSQASDEKGTNGETADPRAGKAMQRPKKKQNLNQKGMDKVGGSELDAFYDQSAATPRDPSPSQTPAVELPEMLSNPASATMITFIQDDEDGYSDAMVAAKNEENAKMSAAAANNNNDITKAVQPATTATKEPSMLYSSGQDATKEQRIQPNESAGDKSASPSVADDAEQPEKGASEAAEAKSSDSEKSDKDEKSEDVVNSVEVNSNGAVQAVQAVAGPSQPAHTYKDGQWSPFNLEGKKVYDREFLLEFKNSTLALTKPDFKLDLDIIRDKPNDSYSANHKRNLHGSSSMTSRSDVMNPMPFRSSSSSNQRSSQGMKMGDRRDRDRGGPGRGMGSLSGSQSGGMGGRMGGGKGFGMGGMMSFGTPGREEPLLHRDPNGGWKPAFLAKRPINISEEVEKLDKFKKKVRGILNKLTPQKFNKLLGQILEIPIETEDYLKEMVNLVFEKAVDEPSFSVAYADLCKQLQTRSTEQGGNSVAQQTTNVVNFRKLLLNKCQEDFEKNKKEELGIVIRQKEIDETTDAEKKKELKLLLEEDERKIRRKSVGLVRFIGELYKLKMLTSKIMHSCIKELLEQVAEEPLECLCKLMTTIGKELESESTKKEFDDYFATMTRLSQKSQGYEVSSRIRFMLQDVIELRQKNWIPRREENKPKTMDQIAKDADRESIEQMLNSQHNMSNKSSNKHMGDDRRRTRPSQDSEGWQTSGTKNARGPSGYQGPIEIPKLMQFKHQNDHSDVSLGSNNSYQSWTTGASAVNGPKRPGLGDSSRAGGFSPGFAGSSYGNKFAILGDRDENKIMSRGGSYGGSSSSIGSKGKVTGSSSLEKQMNMGMRGEDRRSGPPSRDSSRPRYGHPGGQSPATSLSSRGDRDLRPEFPSARGASQPLDNRESTESRTGPAVVPNIPDMDEEKAQNQAHILFDEYCCNHDHSDALLSIHEVFGSRHNVCLFVKNILYKVIDGGMLSHIYKCGQLLVVMLNDKKSVITLDDVVAELAKNVQAASDWMLDVPQFWSSFGQIIAPLVSEELLTFDRVKTMLEDRSFSERSEVFLEILKYLEQNNRTEVWSASNALITDFVPSQEVENFIKTNNLLFLSLSSNNLISPKVKKYRDQLVEILKSDSNRDTFDDAVEFLSKIEEAGVPEKARIEILTMAVIKTSLVDGKLDTNILSKHDRLLTKVIDTKEDRELICLFAIKNFVLNDDASLPTAVLCESFKHLFEKDIISLDGFRNWQTDTSIEPMESAQRLLATKSLKLFYESLYVNEEEYEEEEEES